MAALAVFLAMAPAAGAQAVQLTPFGGQNYTTPFHVAAPPGDTSRVFVVEAAGRIRLVEDGVTQATPFLDVNASVIDLFEGPSGCECGMFSMAFAPDYATSGRFYVFYTRDIPAANVSMPPYHDLVIEEFTRSAADPDVADVSSRRVVLAIPHTVAPNHNGGQLQFGPDGLLYISTGDGGTTPQNAQDRTSQLGKILRIDPRDPPGPDAYSVPAGNPFADGPGGNADEVYAYGLRNPYRFSFDRLTGALSIGDVGSGTKEEIDHAAAGGAAGVNFGWPCWEGTTPSVTTGFCDPPITNHTPPVHEYLNPAVGPAAISGGFVVRDTTVPSLLGRYVYADTYEALGEAIHAIDLTPTGSSGDGPVPGLMGDLVGSFGEDGCGHVYVVELAGPVSRIEPTGGTSACSPQQAPVGISKGPPPLPQLVADTKPPELEVRTRRAKRAGALGEVRLLVRCNEGCLATAEGRISLPGPDIALSPVPAALRGGALRPLSLPLSGRESRRLLEVLDTGRKAKAILGIRATDEAGNAVSAVRRVRQKP